ncbi:hypothetical protein [Cupriavidus metallidurans]|uniref:hypothetical protein n=1 Tax=Cupriavidus metallidurans TaxID=119219 RepID=UPI001BFC977C|nr:hypothetical protein [Cupriavidus metallidurans]QWC91308.1 hypothetical protein KB891_27890 [Cupriavidus metallidurans]
MSVEFEGERPDFRFVAFAQSYDADRFSRALHRIDEVPLFELDSDALVTALTGFKEEADRLRFYVNWGMKEMKAEKRCLTSDPDVPEGFVKEAGGLQMLAVTEYYLAVQAVTGGTVLSEPRRFEPYC